MKLLCSVTSLSSEVKRATIKTSLPCIQQPKTSIAVDSASLIEANQTRSIVKLAYSSFPRGDRTTVHWTKVSWQPFEAFKMWWSTKKVSNKIGASDIVTKWILEGMRLSFHELPESFELQKHLMTQRCERQIQSVWVHWFVYQKLKSEYMWITYLKTRNSFYPGST